VRTALRRRDEGTLFGRVGDDAAQANQRVGADTDMEVSYLHDDVAQSPASPPSASHGHTERRITHVSHPSDAR
jgi:hypothetical protein